MVRIVEPVHLADGLNTWRMLLEWDAELPTALKPRRNAGVHSATTMRQGFAGM
jgi:hypothetical protein